MGLMWAEETERLFVACDLPREVVRTLSVWQLQELEAREDVRVAGSLHLTLAFLGDVRKAKVPRVVEAMSTVPFAPFALRLGQPVFLPQHGARKTIALSVDDPEGGLARLQAGLIAVFPDHHGYPRQMFCQPIGLFSPFLKCSDYLVRAGNNRPLGTFFSSVPPAEDDHFSSPPSEMIGN